MLCYIFPTATNQANPNHHIPLLFLHSPYLYQSIFFYNLNKFLFFIFTILFFNLPTVISLNFPHILMHPTKTINNDICFFIIIIPIKENQKIHFTFFFNNLFIYKYVLCKFFNIWFPLTLPLPYLTPLFPYLLPKHFINKNFHLFAYSIPCLLFIVIHLPN